MKTKIIVILTFLAFTSVKAQNIKDDFEAFKNMQSELYLTFKAKNDSLFAEFIKSNWKSVGLEVPLEKKEFKPKLQPEAPDSIPRFIKHTVKNQQSQTLKKIRSPEYEKLNYYPEELLSTELDFFGIDLNIKYSDKIFITIENEWDNTELAYFYVRVSKTPIISLVKRLNNIREKYALPDYGFYLLVKKFIENTVVDKNLHTPYVWYILKSSYLSAKIGLVDTKPILIFGSDTQLYNHSYFTEGSVNYFVIGEVEGDLFTYPDRDTDENNPFSFTHESIKLPMKSGIREITIGSQQHKLVYNVNTADLLSNFPLVKIENYANSSIQNETRNSLIKAFWPTLKNMTKQQRVQFLLEMVQDAFSYKSDLDQFKAEKIMYLDEFLHYPFSDCDDRSVFFAYLTELFASLETVLVTFPKHVAVGVNMPPPVQGEHFDYKTKRFTFCDPTYLGAPIGAVIPQADRTELGVVE